MLIQPSKVKEPWEEIIGIANRLVAMLIIKVDKLALLLILTLTDEHHTSEEKQNSGIMLAHFILVSLAASQAAAPAAPESPPALVLWLTQTNLTGVTGPSLPEGSRVQ